MSVEMYCHTCESPAKGICYLEHIFDPDHCPLSPNLSEALYTSACGLLPPEELIWLNDGEFSQEKFDLSTVVLEDVGLEAQMNFLAASQLQDTAQNQAEPTASSRTRLDYKPLDPEIPVSHDLANLRRPKSIPNLGVESENRYAEEVHSLCSRALRALKVIEAEKGKMRLTRQRAKDWNDLILENRKYVTILWSFVVRKNRVFRLPLVRPWVGRIENLAMRMELDVKKLRPVFDGL